MVNVQYSQSDRRLAVKRWKCTERDCFLNLCLRGQGVGGQGSQMKQIKGEPWPPGETLAGHRDGIQMEDHGRGYTGGPGTLLLCLCPFLPFLIALFKVPKKSSICGTSHVYDGGVEVASMPFSPCLSPSQLVCLPHPTSSLSASSALLTSWFLFIRFTLGFDAAPSDVVLSTSRVFALGYIGWVYGVFKPTTYII